MNEVEPIVRPRRPDDIPALAEALLAQQSETRYPFRNPLPFPVEDFLHASDATKAWTAELEGRPVGHVCRKGPATGFADADLLNQVCAEAHGCEIEDLTWVHSFFVAADARRFGLGKRLLETVRDDAISEGLHPCLEVLAIHPAAVALYLSTGWREVYRLRPQWLREAAGSDGFDVQVLVFDQS